MKLAAVKALANLAMEESSETVANAYMGQELKFGPEYLIPKPFDPRLIEKIAPAVAKAAMDSGVAKNPIKDFTEYRDKLRSHSFRSGMLMKPVIEQAQKTPKTLVFAEGEDERILRTVQVLSDEGIAKPILVGRPEVINIRIEKLGLRIKLDTNFIITNPQSDPRYEDYWRGYHKIMERQGVSPDLSRTILRTNTTAIAAMMVRRGEADAMICGTYGHYTWHLKHILDIIGTAKNVRQVSAMATLMMGKGTFFLCDTHVTHNPTIEEIVEATLLSAKAVQNFGITPKVALLSHSNFGSRDSETALKMRKATTIIREQSPSLQIEGELQADAALDEAIRKRTFPNSQLSGSANLLIFANVEAANNAFNLLKALGDGVVIGPMLVGAAKTAHIVTPSVNSEGLINMSALAVVDANSREISPQLF
jgi:malate dehydrogenase (oxaloacetate-decarboxylating)(NADP+)